jgi:hypothetical protein
MMHLLERSVVGPVKFRKSPAGRDQPGEYHNRREHCKVSSAKILWRWLNGPAGKAWSVVRGRRGDAYLYWLPGLEPLLWPGDSASAEEKQAWRERC